MEIKIDKIQERLHFLKTKTLSFLKSEFIKISGVAFLLGFLLIYALPLFFDNSSLKFQVTNKVGELLKINLSVNDVDIAFFPSTQIILRDAVIQNYKPDSENLNVAKIYNFYAQKIIIKLPLFNFNDDFKVKEIVFEDVALEKYHDNGSAAIRTNVLTSKLEKITNLKDAKTADIGSGISGKLFPVETFKPSANSYDLPKITISNGSVITYDDFGRKREITEINGSLLFSKEKIVTNGSFMSEDFLSKIDSVIKFKSDIGDKDSFIKITSPILKLNVEGDFTLENKILEEGFFTNNFHGKITANIAELRSFYRGYINNVNIVASRLKHSNNPITITSDITLKDGELLLGNLSAKSTLFEGEGKVSVSKNDKKISIIDVDFTLENIDLDALWTAEKSSASPNNSTNEKATLVPEDSPTQNIDLNLTQNIKNLDLNTEIKAKNVKYLNGQIRNVSLYLTSSNEGKILVMPLSFEVPGQGVFSLNGIIDNDQIYPKFIGKIDGSGESLGDGLKWLAIQSQNLKFDNLKKYNLYSNILILPDSVALNNLYLSINGNESEILGELMLENLGKNINHSGRFKISQLNVDDYFFTSAQNIYLSPGSLLKKLLWLNNLTAGGDFELSFDKLIYKGEVFRNQNTKFKFRHGFLEVYQTSFNSDKMDLVTSFVIDISEIIPKFELDISGKKLHHNTPKTGVIDKDGAVNNNENRNFFDQVYALPSLEDFNGKINIDIADLEIDGLEMADAKLSGNLKEGNIVNATGGLEIYGGKLTYNGFLGIKLRKTINGNFVLREAEINPLLSDIFGIRNIYGVTNISFSVTSVADSKSEFLKDLSSEVKFSSNAPYIEGYGLSDLVKKMLHRNNFAAELRDPEAILINKNSKTVFKEASGNFQVSGGKDPKLKINISAPAVNAILSGDFDPSKNSLNLLFNAIFITGDSKKQTPINIATSIKGNIDNPSQSTNLDQAKQFLGLIKVATSEEKIEKQIQNNVLLPSQNNNLDKTILIQEPASKSEMFKIPTQ